MARLFLILLITTFIPIYLWTYRKLLPEINNAKLTVESWKELSLRLTDIQMITIEEFINSLDSGDPSLPYNTDPIQAHILSLDIVRSLQRLTAEDKKLVKKGCNYLVQVWDQMQQRTRSKIKLYIGEVLSSGIVIFSPNKKLLKKLLSDLN